VAGNTVACETHKLTYFLKKHARTGKNTNSLTCQGDIIIIIITSSRSTTAPMPGYGDEKATNKMDGKIIRAKGGKEIKRMKKKIAIVISDVSCLHALVVIIVNGEKCVWKSSGKT
jgi:hypothetical protein